MMQRNKCGVKHHMIINVCAMYEQKERNIFRKKKKSDRIKVQGTNSFMVCCNVL